MAILAIIWLLKLCLRSMCVVKSALLPSMCVAKTANLLCTWKGAMQTLLRTSSGDIVSGTNKQLKLPYLPFSKHRPSRPMLSISRNVRLFVRLSVCVFTFEVPFERLFAPISRSRMSNIFRDSESLGKSNGRKWSHI